MSAGYQDGWIIVADRSMASWRLGWEADEAKRDQVADSKPRMELQLLEHLADRL